MSQSHPRIFMCHLSDSQYEKLRVVAFERRSNMVDVVRGWIDEESGKPVVGPGADRMPSQGGSTPPTGVNPVVEPPVTVKVPLVEELDWVKCAMCEDRFIREKMKYHKKTNTYLCEDCADK